MSPTIEVQRPVCPHCDLTKKTFTVTVEHDTENERYRPLFKCERSGDTRLILGEWETNSADLARQVARAFQEWVEA